MELSASQFTRFTVPTASYSGLAMSSLPDIQELRPLSGDSAETREEKLRKVAVGFEEIFARILLRSMRASFTNGEMFGSGAIGEIYGDMMDDVIAERMAARSALGLADIMYRQLVKGIDAGEASGAGSR